MPGYGRGRSRAVSYRRSYRPSYKRFYKPKFSYKKKFSYGKKKVYRRGSYGLKANRSNFAAFYKKVTGLRKYK